jgi:hypothetical protein
MKKTSLSLLAVTLVTGWVWLGCGKDMSPLAPGGDQAGLERLAATKKPGGKPGGGGGGGKGSATALVTISGGMATEMEQTFSVAKDSKRTLQLQGGTSGGFPVSIQFNFVNTHASCDPDPSLDDLKANLIDSDFMLRRFVMIRVDLSTLKKVGDVSTTGSDDHFIEVWTDPTQEGGYYFWVPEGPNLINS